VLLSYNSSTVKVAKTLARASSYCNWFMSPLLKSSLSSSKRGRRAL
jgi:hypothetical protein